MRKVQTLTVAIALCLALLFAAPVKADPITGVELPGSDSFAAGSTNALNYASSLDLTPGSFPFVYFVSNTPTSVTLQFDNHFNQTAYFEQRIDSILVTSGTIHYNTDITPDPNYVYPFFALAMGNVIQKTYLASDMVEIRYAFGGDKEWRFDWTAFNAAPAAVPEPGTLLLLGSGLLGLVGLGRKKFRK